MIVHDFATLAARLQQRARALAQARLTARRIAPTRRWHRADWLWPRFAPGGSPWR